MCFWCRDRLALKLSLQVRYDFLSWLAFGGLFGPSCGREVSEGITLQQEAEVSCRRTADRKTHQFAPDKLWLSAMPAKLLPRSQPPLENEGGLIRIAAKLAWCPTSRGQKRQILQMALQFLQ